MKLKTDRHLKNLLGKAAKRHKDRYSKKAQKEIARIRTTLKAEIAARDSEILVLKDSNEEWEQKLEKKEDIFHENNQMMKENVRFIHELQNALYETQNKLFKAFKPIFKTFGKDLKRVENYLAFNEVKKEKEKF